MSPRKRNWSLLFAALVLGGGILELRLAAQPVGIPTPTPSLLASASLSSEPGTTPAPAVEPKITWSPTSVEVILSPGESATRNFTITSDQTIQNIVIEPVPAIAGFLTVQPNALATLPANTPQAISVNFLIPQRATLGTYDGTIHLRDGSQTYPQVSKVVVNILSKFVSPLSSLRVSFYYPEGFAVQLPSEPDAPYILLAGPTADIGGNIITISRFEGTESQFVGYLQQKSFQIIDDSTELFGSSVWRTLTREKPDDGVRLKTSFTEVLGSVFVVSSEDRPSNEPAKYWIMSSLSVVN